MNRLLHNAKNLTFIAFFILSLEAKAISVSAILGFGSSQTTNEITDKEGPLTQIYTLENLLNSNLSIGVEHIRSLATTLTTSISFTGLIARYYINSAPVSYLNPDVLSNTELSYRDYSFFFGGGFGFAQSSKLPDLNGKSSNAAALYISPRVGMDYQLGKNLGVKSELTLATSLIGKGSLSMISLGAGIYWTFK